MNDEVTRDYMTRPFKAADYPRRQVGTITHGGPNQFRCGTCAGRGTVYPPPPPIVRHAPAPMRCSDCNGKGWFAEGDNQSRQASS